MRRRCLTRNHYYKRRSSELPRQDCISPQDTPHSYCRCHILRRTALQGKGRNYPTASSNTSRGGRRCRWIPQWNTCQRRSCYSCCRPLQRRFQPGRSSSECGPRMDYIAPLDTQCIGRRFRASTFPCRSSSNKSAHYKACTGPRDNHGKRIRRRSTSPQSRSSRRNLHYRIDRRGTRWGEWIPRGI